MKTLILLLTMLFASSTGFAQNNPIDFETGGFGADFDWEVFENVDNPPVEIIDNPDATGENTSSKVAQFTARTDGASFAGTITRGTGTYLLDETNRTIKIMVWKSVISDVGIKLETASGWSYGDIKVANTVTDQWEELTFDFSDVPNPPEDEPYDGITVFPDFQERAEENVIFFDNIAFSEQADDGGNGGSTEGNLLTNGDFSDGLNSWEPFIADFEGVSANVTVADGEAAITNIAGAGGEVWHVQLNQLLTSQQIDALEIGETYTASFDARSSADDRQLRLYFGQDGGSFTEVNITDFTINTTMETYDVSFTVNETFDAMKFGFEMGLSNEDVFIDNVSLELSVATSLEELDNRPNQFSLDQNFPNPFNPTTNISFTIPQSSDVKLEVFNALGQKVATLVNGSRNAGSHTVTFDASRFASGVYLYRLTSGTNVQINKMLLLK